MQAKKAQLEGPLGEGAGGFAGWASQGRGHHRGWFIRVFLSAFRWRPRVTEPHALEKSIPP